MLKIKTVTEKNIVCTKVQGRKGTVKEYINSNEHRELYLFGLKILTFGRKCLD